MEHVSSHQLNTKLARERERERQRQREGEDTVELVSSHQLIVSIYATTVQSTGRQTHSGCSQLMYILQREREREREDIVEHVSSHQLNKYKKTITKN